MKRILLLIIILILMLGSCVSCRNESYIKESNNNATGVGTENDNNVEEASSVQDPDRIEVTSDKDNLKNKVTVLDVSEFVVTKNEPERIKEYESFNAQIDAINNSGINYCIAEIETEGYDFAVTFTADEWLNTLRISGKSFLRFSVLEVLENYGCDIAKGSKITIKRINMMMDIIITASIYNNHSSCTYQLTRFFVAAKEKPRFLEALHYLNPLFLGG